jgi:hypothetical protein
LRIPAIGDELAVGDFLAQCALREAAGRALLLREELADLDSEVGAGAKHAEARLAQRDVLLVGGADERVKDRVVEDGPPLAEVRRVLAEADVVGIDPVLGDRRRGLAVVGADLEAIVDVLAQGRAAANADQDGKEAGRKQAADAHG